MITIFGEESYENAVLAEREANYLNDSDFYATVWDEMTQSVKEIQIGTTRFPSDYSVYVDATEQVYEKAFNYLNKKVEDNFESIFKNTLKYEKSRRDVDDLVEVVSGRKVPKGTRGTIVKFLINSYDFSGYNPRVALRLENGDIVYSYLNNISRIVDEDKVKEKVLEYKVDCISPITLMQVERAISWGLFLDDKVK